MNRAGAFIARLAQLYQMFVVRRSGAAEPIVWVVCGAPVVALCALVEYYGGSVYRGPCDAIVLLNPDGSSVGNMTAAPGPSGAQRFPLSGNASQNGTYVDWPLAGANVGPHGVATCGCSTALAWRIGLLIVVLSKVPVAVWLWTQLRHVRPSFHQHAELQRGLVLSLALFVPALFVHFRGLLAEPAGRFVFSMATLGCVAYFFAVTALPPIIARLRGDASYLEDFERSLENIGLGATGTAKLDRKYDDFMRIPSARAHFLTYVEGLAGCAHRVTCLRDIEARRRLPAPQLAGRANSLITLYIMAGAVQDVCAPSVTAQAIISAPDRSDPRLFDELETWILRALEPHYASFTATPDFVAVIAETSLRDSENETGRSLGLVGNQGAGARGGAGGSVADAAPGVAIDWRLV